MVALKNRMGHQVDADGKLRGGTWQVDGRLQRRCCLGTWVRQVSNARQLIGTTILPSHTHNHNVRTPRCLQLLLTSLPRRARAAGLLLRLPAAQPKQATAGSAAAGHAGGQEAACRGRS